MSIVTYNIPVKNRLRHEILSYAVDLLTVNRNQASCIRKTYVRELVDYFKNIDESHDQQEVKKIKPAYVIDWENLHHSFVGYRKPEELSVCYLSGPEPLNDFEELINLGIHPQNIWSFENNKIEYDAAVQSLETKQFPLPKVSKESIENFFKFSPKKFDIVYIDACGSIPLSEQHTLRMISTLLKFHRLNSPGVLITNFSEPDTNNPIFVERYNNAISSYLLYKKNTPYINTEYTTDPIKDFETFKLDVAKNFDLYYEHFITRLLMDVSSLVVPILRFTNSTYYTAITNHLPRRIQSSKEDILNISSCSTLKSFILQNVLMNKKYDANLSKDISRVFDELAGIDNYAYNVVDCLYFTESIKNGDSKINDIIDFNKTNIFQFLDKPTSSLFIDAYINQMSFPMHYNTLASKRYGYKSKKTKMYLDISVLDECRYLYEWLPSLNLLGRVCNDPSWQYTFRFALDGLIKQRLLYNDEFFYQGSVISDKIYNFNSAKLSKRVSFGGFSNG